MSERTKATQKGLFRTNLDSEISALPGRSWKSALGLFAHLENLCQRREPSLHSVLKQLSARRIRGAAKADCSGEIPPERVSYRDIGRQVVRAARAQVRSLQHRVEETQSLVLINNWSIADRLWSELVPECKTPLFLLSFLEELWGLNPDQFEAGGWSLTRQWHEFVLIQAEFEILLGRRRGLLEFSDALERDLGNWLARFAELLEKLDEASTA